MRGTECKGAGIAADIIKERSPGLSNKPLGPFSDGKLSKKKSPYPCHFGKDD
jgi:hypothetical protein